MFCIFNKFYNGSLPAIEDFEENELSEENRELIEGSLDESEAGSGSDRISR